MISSLHIYVYTYTYIALLTMILLRVPVSRYSVVKPLIEQHPKCAATHMICRTMAIGVSISLRHSFAIVCCVIYVH